VLGRFDQWYSQQIGIAPTRAVETLRAIIRDKENAFNDAVRPVARQASDLYDSKWQAIRRKHNYRRDAEECTFIEQFRTRATARIAGFNLGSARPSFLHIPAYPPRLVPPITDIEWNGLILS
jgi:hypothetical protein